MDRFFLRIARAVVRYRRLVLVAWVGLLVFGVLFAPRLHEVFEREFVSGNTGESQQASDVIASAFTSQSPYQEQLVFRSTTLTAEDPRYREAAWAVIAAVEATGLVTGVESFYSAGDPRFLSPDRRTTYALVNLRSKTQFDGMAASQKIMQAADQVAKPPWLKSYLTGQEAVQADLTKASEASVKRAEMVGLPIALVVLVFVFGALVAAGLPLLVGALSILVALALAFLVGQWVDLSLFLENIVTMLGLGVGIDYALFMVTRFRAERKAGLTADAAAVATVTSAGKAVTFSGLTVIVGLLALLATREPFVMSMGIGGMLVVAVAIVAALTLLPAGLSLLGDRIERPRFLGRMMGHVHDRGFWARWAGRVMRRPLVYLTLGLVVLAVLAAPALDLRTGPSGVKLLGAEAESRQGFEVMEEEFGAALMSPVQIVVRKEGGIWDAQSLTPPLFCGWHVAAGVSAERLRYFACPGVTRPVS
ncbi:MAG: MMPL family transporter [Actinobacteria bacterium]|nr:MMPL family transporter [Actinomycetota bacterium]